MSIDSLSVKIKNSIILKGLSEYWPTRVIDFTKGDLEVDLFVIKGQGNLDYIERLKGQTSRTGTNVNIFLGFTYGKMYITEDELKHYMLIDQEQHETKTVDLEEDSVYE